MADDKKHIDDLLRDGFFGKPDMNEDFIPDSWTELSKKLDQEPGLDNHLRQSFNLEEEPPTESWEAIQDQLDIDTVWNNIAAKKDRRRPVFFYLSVAATILFLIGFEFNTVLVSNPELNQRVVQSSSAIGDKSFDQQNQQYKILSENNIDSEADLTYSFNKDASGSSPASLDPLTNTEHSQQNVYANLTVAENDVRKDQHSELSENQLKLLPINEINTLPQQIVPDFKEEAKIHIEKPAVEKQNKFTIGATTALVHTWVSSPLSRSGLNKNSLVINNFVVKPKYGVFFSYALNEKFELLTEISINETIASSQNYYEQGSFIQQRTELRYTKVSLLGKYNLPISTSHKHHLSFGFGGYYAKLQNNLVVKNDVFVALNDGMKGYDLGLRSELGHQYQLKKWSLNYGFVFDYGLTDINNSTYQTSINSGRMNNLSAGCFLRVGYSF